MSLYVTMKTQKQLFSVGIQIFLDIISFDILFGL